MFCNKRFRSIVCVLLSFLTLVHTTPLYAVVEVSEVTPSGSLKPAGSSQPASDPTPDSPDPQGEVPAPAATLDDPGTGAANDIPATPQAPGTNLSTGAATYSIPIEVPIGRLGISPNIAITYNSYSQSSLCGVGFTLDLGSIQRSTKKGLNYTSSNFVASINGSTSDLVQRTAWGSSCYGSKIEGAFLKYCNSDLWKRPACQEVSAAIRHQSDIRTLAPPVGDPVWK